MNVAIMGAGLSGLACAIILERNGVSPTIYEKRSQVGDRFINAEALMNLLTRPILDPIQYFMEHHEIDLKPLSHIRTLKIFSENEKATIEGLIGFVNVRGRHHLSFEQQLANQVQTPIHFHSEYTYEQLLHEHSHVVMATGDGEYTRKLQPYTLNTSASLTAATVEGSFNPYTAMVWLNNHFAPKGYGYILPFSEKEANIVIAYPDNVVTANGDQLFQSFHQECQKHLNQELTITDQFQVSNYLIGRSHFPRIGNTLFTGNCLGTNMPFLGYGQFASILSGIFAAYDILGKANYEQFAKKIYESYEDSLVLRRMVEKLDNDTFDKIVKKLDGPIGAMLFHQTRLNPLRIASLLLRPFMS
ncbi:NAD(P)/FAD-dependent oxidoreductase [Bacillus kexueae]|uniref:NAD(P)/FAD-dependent oxidoreductase n=1 Tax=Aeribacillus kexueae TaxID=2078952 RepID=UPI001FAF7332|nr:NAD(P)/FAD-dependent oxidoreductase [Bacillus kexueae]